MINKLSTVQPSQPSPKCSQVTYSKINQMHIMNASAAGFAVQILRFLSPKDLDCVHNLTKSWRILVDESRLPDCFRLGPSPMSSGQIWKILHGHDSARAFLYKCLLCLRRNYDRMSHLRIFLILNKIRLNIFEEDKFKNAASMLMEQMLVKGYFKQVPFEVPVKISQFSAKDQFRLYTHSVGYSTQLQEIYVNQVLHHFTFSSKGRDNQYASLELAQAFLEHRYNFKSFSFEKIYTILRDCYESHTSKTYKCHALVTLAKISVVEKDTVDIDWILKKLRNIKTADFPILQKDIEFYSRFYKVRKLWILGKDDWLFSQLKKIGNTGDSEMKWRAQLMQMKLLYSGKWQWNKEFKDPEDLFQILENLIKDPLLPFHEKVFAQYSYAVQLYNVYKESKRFYMSKDKEYTFFGFLHEEEPLDPQQSAVKSDSCFEPFFQAFAKKQKILNTLSNYHVIKDLYKYHYERVTNIKTADRLFMQILNNPQAPVLYRIKSGYFRFKIRVFTNVFNQTYVNDMRECYANFSKIAGISYCDPQQLEKPAIGIKYNQMRIKPERQFLAVIN